MTTLQIIWFLLVGVLFIGYSILDGFDLGVGIWYLFFKKEEERHALHYSVGPFWDGNEVWLLTAGGAMFAAFPLVYATVFSGLYLALMLVLFALIFRAVSFEFRNKIEDLKWRKWWDWIFSVSSALPSLLFGVALGNMVWGLPMDDKFNYAGGFFNLLNPYSLLFGVAGFFMFARHGAIYIAMRSVGEMREKARGYAILSCYAYLALSILLPIATVFMAPWALNNYKAIPVLWIIPILSFASLIGSAALVRFRKYGWGFIVSSINIALMWGTVGASLFPNLVNPRGAGAGLSLANSSSGELTLQTMLIIAIIGVPIALGYTFWVYKTFWGNVNDETHKGY